MSGEIDQTLKEICEEISKRYEIRFLEIGREGDHVHFLVQSVSMHGPTKIVKAIKSILAKKVFERHPEVKKQLWGGEFWAEGHFISRVSKDGNEEKNPPTTACL
jgi:REP element-mobilizing transposase RayT